MIGDHSIADHCLPNASGYDLKQVCFEDQTIGCDLLRRKALKECIEFLNACNNRLPVAAISQWLLYADGSQRQQPHRCHSSVVRAKHRVTRQDRIPHTACECRRPAIRSRCVRAYKPMRDGLCFDERIWRDRTIELMRRMNTESLRL